MTKGSLIKSQFICPLYPVRIIVATGDKSEIDKIRKSCEWYLSPSMNPVRWARCDSNSEMGCCGLFFITPALKDEGAIAHEIAHLAFWICHYCQVTVEWPHDEAYAHLVGFLTIKINAILRGFQKRKLSDNRKKVHHRRIAKSVPVGRKLRKAIR